MLLRGNAHPLKRLNDGSTALKKAEEAGHDEVVAILRQATGQEVYDPNDDHPPMIGPAAGRAASDSGGSPGDANGAASRPASAHTTPPAGAPMLAARPNVPPQYSHASTADGDDGVHPLEAYDDYEDAPQAAERSGYDESGQGGSSAVEPLADEYQSADDDEDDKAHADAGAQQQDTDADGDPLPTRTSHPDEMASPAHSVHLGSSTAGSLTPRHAP